MEGVIAEYYKYKVLAPPSLRSAGLTLRGNKHEFIVFDLAISRDYILTDGHDILKVLNVKCNFT
jgi:hypothetical protein